jgi:chemotaxis protein MotB
MTGELHPGVARRSRTPIGRIGGAWKVAYADLATAMMALFLVLWLGSQDVVIREAVARYFQDPIGFDRGVEGGTSPLGGAGSGNGPIDGLLNAPRLERKAPAREALDRAAKQLRRTLEAMPSFQALGRFALLEVSDDGLRIDLIEQDGSSFFARGGRELSREGAEIVRAIGRELAALGSSVVLEGHTDALPFRGEDGYSNWELSADRANSARRALEAGGVAPGQVKAVRGYADQRLQIPEAPSDPRNRRIAILVSAKPAVRESAARPTPE